MWRYELVHDRHPFEEDVHDVECREQPFVLAGRELEVVSQAGDFGITDV